MVKIINFIIVNKFKIIFTIILTLLVKPIMALTMSLYYNYKYPTFCFENNQICINKPKDWYLVQSRIDMKDNFSLSFKDKSWFNEDVINGVVFIKSEEYIKISMFKKKYITTLSVYKEKMKLIPCYKNYHCFIFKEDKLKNDKSIFVFETKLFFSFWKVVGTEYMSREKSLKLLEEILK